MIEGISAITLATHEMSQAVRFYRALGFEVLHGGEESSFTSFRAGTSYLNLIAQPAERRWSWWGRVIFYVTDVDALYNRALAAGCQPTTAPRDAEWGERFFHLTDHGRPRTQFRSAFAPGLIATRSSLPFQQMQRAPPRRPATSKDEPGNEESQICLPPLPPSGIEICLRQKSPKRELQRLRPETFRRFSSKLPIF